MQYDIHVKNVSPCEWNTKKKKRIFENEWLSRNFSFIEIRIRFKASIHITFVTAHDYLILKRTFHRLLDYNAHFISRSFDEEQSNSIDIAFSR